MLATLKMMTYQQYNTSLICSQLTFIVFDVMKIPWHGKQASPLLECAEDANLWWFMCSECVTSSDIWSMAFELSIAITVGDRGKFTNVSIGIVTACSLNGRGIWIQSPVWSRDSFLLHIVQTDSGPTQPLVQCMPERVNLHLASRLRIRGSAHPFAPTSSWSSD